MPAPTLATAVSLNYNEQMEPMRFTLLLAFRCSGDVIRIAASLQAASG
jgi:hypothetical protein